VPSDVYRRLSTIGPLLSQAASRSCVFFRRVARFIRATWTPDSQESESKSLSLPPTHRLVKRSSLWIPPIAAIVVFPRGSFLAPLALVAFQAFLWFMLLVTLRSMPWFLRKLLEMIIFSCIIFDCMLLADFFQKHETAGWTLASNQFGSILLVLCGLWGLGLLWILLSRSKSGRECVHVLASQD
jgi:hypothetical protein